MNCPRWLLLTGLLIVLPLATAFGQQKKAPAKSGPPQVACTLPIGIPSTGTNKFSVRGVRLDSATEIRFHEPKTFGRILSRSQVAVPNMQDPDRVGNTQVEVEVTLPLGLSARSIPFSFVGPNGQGNARQLLLLADLPIVQEKEPNNGFRQSQAVQLPVAVQGSITQPQDVDVFRFEATAGQRLRAEVQAARYGSALDSRLTLYDAAGQQVAVCDDHEGSADSLLELRLPHAGSYYLCIADALDQGGPTHVYCLTATLDE